MLHPLAWLGWLVAALVALSVTRNPLYLCLILLCLALVKAGVRTRNEAQPMPLSLLRFGLIVTTTATLFNAAIARAGTTTLFTLPAFLPVIGGAVTLEAFIFGALNGLALTGFYAAFMVMNTALSVRTLIRFIPRAFTPVAVVVSIAVAFVPTTLQQFRQIREAQAIRGHRIRKLRDWAPLLMPLLISGLERALQLAEAMTARGFAANRNQAQGQSTQIALVVGLAALLGGWLLRLAWQLDALGMALMIVGAGALLGALIVTGRRVPRTSYRVEPWTWRDGGVLGGAALVIGIFLLQLPGIDRSSLFYAPYPTLQSPAFAPLIGFATLALTLPAILQEGRQSQTVQTAVIKQERRSGQ
ncbi:MAG: energy-coupling factor transporter transmembrane protein EcfT [Chloroflexales bacterium]|nr:energy-coupling factor transporter transmembrane protein EcfT [Chloroflexales bacterium]